MDEATTLYDLSEFCRPHFSEEQWGRFFVRIEKGMDWEALFQAALAHDVAPLLVHRVLLSFGEHLPDELREGLELFLEGERLKAQAIARQLTDLLKCMADRGIPVIPLKGPRLALDLYGEADLRSCRDLDFLVRDTDIAPVLAGLAELGYSHEPSLDPRHIEVLRRYGGQYILFHPRQIPVEPHWRVAPDTLAFDLDYPRLWQRARRSEFREASCLRLPPEEEFLLLCLHGAKEQWEKLKWICDLAFFLDAHPDLDWRRLYADAAQQGCVRMLHLGVVLANRLLGSPIPPELLAHGRENRAATPLAEQVIRRFEHHESALHDPYRLSRFYWRMRERPRDRWAYAVRTVFTPRVPHYRLLHLPAGLEWGYYPLKLLWDYVVLPCQRLAGKSPDTAP